MKRLVNAFGCLFEKLIKGINYCRKEYQKSKLEYCGKNVYLGSDCIMTERNIRIGNEVYVGPRCIFQSTYGKIRIGNHVMFGPGVNIHGGNHRIREIGTHLDDVSPKKDGDDGVVTIGDDCWIGANAIILSNVTIGEGSVIGGGSIVTKDVPPYSIYTGSHAPQIRPRFDQDSEKKHIQMIELKYKE